MTNLEFRTLRLENDLTAIKRQLADLYQQVGKIAQNQWVPGMGGGGGGGGAGAFKFVSASGIAAGGSATETIQQMSGGSWSSIGTATVRNPMPSDAILAGHTCPCVPDGSGGYVAVSQSCT
jgi:hypothetical protein